MDGNVSVVAKREDRQLEWRKGRSERLAVPAFSNNETYRSVKLGACACAALTAKVRESLANVIISGRLGLNGAAKTVPQILMRLRIPRPAEK